MDFDFSGDPIYSEFGLPGDTPADLEVPRGPGEAVDFVTGFGDLWSDVRDTLGLPSAGDLIGGLIGAAKGTPAKKKIPMLPTSIPFKEPDMADIMPFPGSGGGGYVNTGDTTWSLSELAQGTGLNGRQLKRAIQAYGMAVVPWLVQLCETNVSTLLTAYFRTTHRRRSRGITGRQIGNARRVIRTIASFQHALGGMRGGGSQRRYFPRRRRRA